MLDVEGEEAGRISGSPADGYYPFEVWQAGEVVRDPLWFVPTQPMNLKAGILYRLGVTVSAGGEPLNPDPAGASDGFVPLGTIEFLLEEEKEE